MGTTIPDFSDIPNTQTQTESEYDAAWNQTLSELPVWGSAANALGAEVEVNAANAEAAAGALADAKWVSGTTYAEGDVRWSPNDHLNYRRKNNGAGTTDPSLDLTNWVLLTKTNAGGSDTTSGAVDIALTFTSGRLQIISMTAANKKVTLPVATVLQKGAPVFVIKNSGLYKFAVRDNDGNFLANVRPDQVIALHCSDISTAEGLWSVSGQDVEQTYVGNTAEVINATASQYIDVAMLTSLKAICAYQGASNYLEAVILNYDSASGTPVVVNAEASLYISIAAQTSSQATVVYKTSTGVTKGYVLDHPSGTTINPGTVKSIDAATGGIGTSLTALSATQLLLLYQGSAASTPRERILDIALSVITASSEVVADTVATSGVMQLDAVSASKALVTYRDNTGASVRLRLQSVSGSTPSPTGSALAFSQSGILPTTHYGLAVLDANRALVATGDSLNNITVGLFDVTGTSPVFIRQKTITGNKSSPAIKLARLTDNLAHLIWVGSDSAGAASATITVTADNEILVDSLIDSFEDDVTSTTSAISNVALDSTHVITAVRNSSTYLSAKTLELSA